MRELRENGERAEAPVCAAEMIKCFKLYIMVKCTCLFFAIHMLSGIIPLVCVFSLHNVSLAKYFVAIADTELYQKRIASKS